MGLSDSELLFYSGIAIVVLSVIGGIIAAAILTASGRRLDKKLEIEFGKKRH